MSKRQLAGVRKLIPPNQTTVHQEVAELRKAMVKAIRDLRVDPSLNELAGAKKAIACLEKAMDRRDPIERPTGPIHLISGTPGGARARAQASR